MTDEEYIASLSPEELVALARPMTKMDGWDAAIGLITHLDDNVDPRILGALGPAFRHMARIEEGSLRLSPQVESEIEDSIAKAEELAFSLNASASMTPERR